MPLTLLSHILGMLVHYFPSIWIALLHDEKGVVVQALLLAATSVIASDYPKLAVNALA